MADAGQRLDQYLAAQLASYSRTRLQRQISEGDVLVNDRVAKASYRVQAGDHIEIELPAPAINRLVAEPMQLDIVYEDEEIVVVNKPAGLTVHPGAGVAQGTLANGLVAHFTELSTAASPLRPGIVHRLDRDTSGLLVVAKTELAHQHLADQFATRKVEKDYCALVYGQVAAVQGKIDLPIGRHPVHRTKMCIAKPGQGRTALTYYYVRRRYHEFTELNVQIKTGRTHQIRVHLAYLHHPVVGDEIYGTGRATSVHDLNARRAIAALGRHFLHASRLAFTHPVSGAWLEFTAPLPPELNNFLTVIVIDSN
ncbi:MAG: RluA family pseudouridine synthase [Acidobacteriota bacterium]